MKKSIKLFVVIYFIIIILITLSGCTKVEENNDNYKIVTSFYPIYIMTENIVQDAENLELSNMTDISAGCLHNYTLQTTDLKKVEKANVFIENGLGIESFHDKLLSSFSSLQIIDSSKNISEVLQDEDEINGHTWLSIENYIKQVEEIKIGLQEKNPDNSEIYEKNTQEYVEKLTELKEKYETELAGLKGKKVVSLDESFAYLLRDLGMEVIQIHTDHEESTLSAESIKSVIEEMKENNIEIIIIDKDEDEKNALTIQNETDSKIYKLDSGLTGNLDKDAYIKTMNKNLEVLKEML